VTDNHVTGKRKKGGISFDGKDSLVCKISLGDDVYPVRAVIPGQLLEVFHPLHQTLYMAT